MGADVAGVGALTALEIGIREEQLHIHALGVGGKHGADLGDGLRVQLAARIDAGERAARHAHFGRLHAVAPAVQPLQFSLNRGVGGLHFEGALHVPDGVVEFVFLVADDAQADVRHEVVGDSHEQATKNLHGVGITARLEIGFAEQAVGFEMFGKRLEDVAAMGNRLVVLPLFDKAFDLTIIDSQRYFCHYLFL